MKELRLCDSGKFEEVLKLCRKYNLGIEVQSFVDPSVVEKNKYIISEYRDKLQGFELGKSLHAPYWDLNIGSKINGIRNTTMDMFNYAYDIATTLGCSGIVVHNGYIPGTYFEVGWIERSIAMWKDFFKGKNERVTYYIENQFELSGTIIKNVVDGVNDSRLKACLDLGHVNAHSRESVQEWIELLGDRIGYVHMHNNHGKKDEHLGFDNGTLSMLEVFRSLDKASPEAIWNIEVNIGQMEPSIKYLRGNGII